MLRLSILASVATAINIVAPAGDPECKLGHRSFQQDESKVAVCCPKYCGKCDDWAGCESVNGQASENACCASKVRALTCENNAKDPHCLTACKGKSAPCSLGAHVPFKAPAETDAAGDCNTAEKKFINDCGATVKSVNPDGPGDSNGKAQWKDVQEKTGLTDGF